MSTKQSRNFMHKHAVATNLRPRVGLTGASRSGKTKSGLEIGSGIAEVLGKPLFVIDTENGFSLDYANQYDFEHVDFQPPFNPLAYIDAIQYCEKAGAGVIMIDSMSHEHTGEGGVLMEKERVQDELAAKWKCNRDKVSDTAWNIAKAQPHAALVTAVQRCPLPIIFCFRAKDKIKIVEVENDGRKKQERVHLGWQPICTEQFEFEMTGMFLLPPNAQGVPDKECSELRDGWKPLFKFDGKPITRDFGRKVAEWAAGGQCKQEAQPKNLEELNSQPGNGHALPDGFITADQAIEIGDKLAARADLKAKIIKKYGAISKIPAEQYHTAINWINEQIGGQ